jgi:Mg2+-importing ATPase
VLALSADLRPQIDATLNELSRAGYHVLGIAHRSVVDGLATLRSIDETGLTFGGFIAFLDPPDPSAAGTLSRLAAAGLSIKILSGDSDLVCRTIGQQVGLRTDQVVVGKDLEKMTDEALWAVVEQTEIFARVSPAQKNRIIRALKHRGHVVGYLGDGINDAPSLHAADVGISVSNGVDCSESRGRHYPARKEPGRNRTWSDRRS